MARKTKILDCTAYFCNTSRKIWCKKKFQMYGGLEKIWKFLGDRSEL